MSNRYKRALNICTANLSNEEGLDPIKSALCFFRMGLVLSKMREIDGAIRCFNDAFLLRDKSIQVELNEQWHQFHEIQIGIYINGKRNKIISSLAEGDMVHDLIKNRWYQLINEVERSEIPLATRNLKKWFKTVKIDFPWDMEDLEEANIDKKDLFSTDISLSVSK
ncbi:MAG: hypothetical protein WCZ17_12080 [Candidatus Kapaibacterium sp.]